MADRSVLFHAVLQRFFRARRDGALPAEALRAALLEELERCLAEMPVDAPPYRRRMMERALRDALSLVAQREERYRERFPLAPAHCALAFGAEELDAEEIDHDPESSTTPLVVPREDGAPIELRGTIDRVDLTADGRGALPVDFTLGSSVEFPAMKEGTSLQMPLQMMALEQVWSKQVIGGCYDSPQDAGRRRFIRRDQVDMRAYQPVPGVENGREVKPVSAEEYAEVLEVARRAVREAVAGIQAVHLLPATGEHCRHCDYADVCRTGRDGGHDGEPLPGANAMQDGKSI